MGKSVKKTKTTPVAIASTGVGCGMGFVLAGFLLRDWDFSEGMWSALTIVPPLIAAIIAGRFSWNNGQADQKDNKEKVLRERFTSIIEMLSPNDNDLLKREAGIYELVTLSDDWADFYENEPQSAIREQQNCLNILTQQLSDPLTPHEYDPKICRFKQLVQYTICSKFSDRNNEGPGPWSHLALHLENCHLYQFEYPYSHFSGINFSGAHFHNKTEFKHCQFKGNATFTDATFHDNTSFEGAIFNHPILYSDFNSAHFEKYSDFTNAQFRETYFVGTKFDDGANFTEVKFYYITDFSNAKFHVKPTTKVNFRNEITFEKAELQKEFHLNDETYFPKDTSFKNAKFHILKSDKTIKYLKELGADLTGSEYGVMFKDTNRRTFWEKVYDFW